MSNASLPTVVYVLDKGLRFVCQLVQRNVGPTFVCALCHQGVIARDGDVRNRCRVCGRKAESFYAPLPDAAEEKKAKREYMEGR